ncbi:MAG: ABC transporter ATP-binding protein, partial [Gammaproteobacteria bacterium]
MSPAAPPADNFLEAMSRQFAVFAYTRRAIALVWDTNYRLAVALALLTLTAGLLPAAMAWVGKLIVDGVVLQMDLVRGGAIADYWAVLRLVLVEGLIIALLNSAQRGINACQSLLRA